MGHPTWDGDEGPKHESRPDAGEDAARGEVEGGDARVVGIPTLSERVGWVGGWVGGLGRGRKGGLNKLLAGLGGVDG